MRRELLSILLFLAGAGAFFKSTSRDSWWSYAAGVFWAAGYVLMGGNLYGWSRGDLRKLYTQR